MFLYPPPGHTTSVTVGDFSRFVVWEKIKFLFSIMFGHGHTYTATWRGAYYISILFYHTKLGIYYL